MKTFCLAFHCLTATNMTNMTAMAAINDPTIIMNNALFALFGLVLATPYSAGSANGVR